MKRFTLALILVSMMSVVARAANTQRTVSQVTSTVTISQAWDYHITSTTPFATTGSVNITNADAVVIFDNVQPYEAQAFLTYIKINGAAAVNHTNCQIKIYNKGAIIMPHGDSFQPLTVYSTASYGGTSYSNYNVGTKYNLTSASMNNNIKSFKLKRGYMVCMSNRPDGLGVNRLWVAANEDLSVALPAVLAGRVSWLRIVQWNNVSKKGLAGNDKTANDLLETTWTYNWDASGTTAMNQEYVTMLRQRWWPSVEECDNNSATCILGQNEPENTGDSNEAQYARSATEVLDQDWVKLMQTGKRLGSPAPSNYANGWLEEFMNGIDERGWRCDYVVLHCYWYSDWSSWKSTLDGIYNKYKRPIWITEMNYGANWTGWPGSDRTGSTANQQIEYNHMKPILDGLASTGYIERIAVYNNVEECRYFILNGSRTLIGDYYADLDMGLAYNSSYLESPAAPTYTAITNLSNSYNFGAKTVTLTWTDPNYDLTDRYVVQMSSNNGSSWTTIGTLTDLADDGVHTFSYSLTTAGTYLFRVQHTSYANETLTSNTATQEVIANISESSTGVDLTSIISNPAGASGSMTGWDCWNASQAAWQYQSSTKTNGSVSVSGFFERWQASGDPSTLADSYARQTFSGLPNGVYVLEADVIACNQNATMTYTNDQKGAYLYAKGYRANHVEFTTGDALPEHKTVTTYVNDNTLTIGFKTDFTRDNWVGFDNVKLTYNGGTAAIFKAQIDAKISAANSAKSSATSAVQEAITAAVTEATTVRNASSSTATDYCEVIARLENLTMQAQSNNVLTYYSDDDRWAHNITPTTKFSTKEYYNSAPFDFNRTLTNLSAGVYTLKVQGFQRPGSNADAQTTYAAGTDDIQAYIYAGSSEKKLLNVMADGLTSSQANCSEYRNTNTGKYVPNDMHTANVYFGLNCYENELSFLVKEDGTSLPIGLKSLKNGGAYWTIFDNFRLVYNGKSAAALKAYMDILLAEVFDAPMYHVAKENMLAAKTQLETDYNNGDGDAMFTHMGTLEEAIAVAKESAAVYADLTAALNWSQTKKTTYSRTAGASTYTSEYNAVNSNYINGAYTNEEVAGAIIDVKELTNKYLMSDIVAANTASESNPVDVTSFILDNASFTSGSDSWYVSGTVGGGYSGAVEYECFEIWNNTFGVSQTLYGMPSGFYRVETQAFYREGGQAEHKALYEAGTLSHQSKVFIQDAAGEYTYGNIMPISQIVANGTAITGQVGDWYDYNAGSNLRVPDRMESAGNAFDTFHLYQPTEDYNRVQGRFVNSGSHASLTIGGIKMESVQYDWTIFAEFKIYYLGNTVTLDETADTAPQTYQGVNVQFNRTIAGKNSVESGKAWNTICFPFALDASQISSIFGAGTVVKELSGVTFNGDNASLTFTQVNSIEANKPYIMQVNTGQSVYTIENVNVVPSNELTTTVDGVQFVGNYVYPKVMDNAGGTDYYILNDVFKSSTGRTKIKGYRAYFHVPTSAGVKTLGFSIDDEGTVTGIQTVDGAFVTLPADVYSLSGQLVHRQATSLKGLPRGTYLVGGQKVLVR